MREESERRFETVNVVHRMAIFFKLNKRCG